MHSLRAALLAFVSSLTLAVASTHAEAEPVECRSAILKAAAAFVHAKTRALQRCEESVVKRKLPRSTDCQEEAKAKARIERAAAKLGSTIVKKCGGNDRLCGTADDDDLADIGWDIGACPNIENGACTNPIANCQDIATCLECIGAATVDQTIGLAYDALNDTDPMSGTEKALNECQVTIGKEAAKFLLRRSKALQRCQDGLNRGSITDSCPDATAQATIETAETKRVTKICETCGGADEACGGGDDRSPAEIGFVANCPDLDALGAQGSCAGTIASFQDIVDCVDCVTEYTVDSADRAAGGGFPTVTFTDEDGRSVAAPANRGEVLLIAADGVGAADIDALVIATGGALSFQDEVGGVYVATVPIGTEDGFIAAVRPDPRVLHAVPNLIGVAHQAAGQFPGGVQCFVLDNFLPGFSHGPDVRAIANDGGGDFQAVDVFGRVGGRPAILGNRLTSAIRNLASSNPDAIIVFNISVGAEALNEGGEQATTDTWMNTVANTVNDLTNAVAVQSSGNGVAGRNTKGVNIDSALQGGNVSKALDDRKLVVVGGSGKPGSSPCIHDAGQNFSTDPRMVYAPGRDVPIPGTGTQRLATGTSFATPQVSRAICDEAKRNPNRTLRDIVEAALQRFRCPPSAGHARYRLRLELQASKITTIQSWNDGMDSVDLDLAGDVGLPPLSTSQPVFDVAGTVTLSTNSFLTSLLSGTGTTTFPSADVSDGALLDVVVDPSLREPDSQGVLGISGRVNTMVPFPAPQNALWTVLLFKVEFDVRRNASGVFAVLNPAGRLTEFRMPETDFPPDAAPEMSSATLTLQQE